jgi:hypothetical protein
MFFISQRVTCVVTEEFSVFRDITRQDGGEVVSFKRRPRITPEEDSSYIVKPRAIVRLEGLGELKIPVTSSVMEVATLRLVA